MSDLVVKEPPVCPHCGEVMGRFTLPPVTFGDGLGWNSQFLWMCASDECPVFRKGFEQAFEMYGRTVSMRAIVEPDTGRTSVTPAFTADPGHIKTFLDARAKHAGSPHGENRNPADDEWPDVDDYGPGKGSGGE
jgi:hypothetical protein